MQAVLTCAAFSVRSSPASRLMCSFSSRLESYSLIFLASHVALTSGRAVRVSVARAGANAAPVLFRRRRGSTELYLQVYLPD